MSVPLRLMLGALALLALFWAAGRLRQRWSEEAVDRVVALAVDWEEFRELAARAALSPIDLMSALRARGATALIISPVSLNALFQERRIQLLDSPPRGDPWDVAAIRLSDQEGLAAKLTWELSARGVEDLRIRRESAGTVLWRARGTFAALRDIALGFDQQVVKALGQARLAPVFRIYEEPWMSRENVLETLKLFPLSTTANGLLFSSDELPGGLAALPAWRSWIEQSCVTQFLPEFHPALAAWQMSRAAPANAYRAHSIPAAELKDMKPVQQLARWRRASEERSCRLLLVHVAPNDSLNSFLGNLDGLGGMLRRDHWSLGFPGPRIAWKAEGRLHCAAMAAAAFAIAVFAPLFALRCGRGPLPRPWLAFLRISCLSIAGGLLVSAVAQNPETRLEITPFRGIKAAFVLSWLACLWVLYDRQDLKSWLMQTTKHWEILAVGMALAAVAYLLVRTDNAPSAWTHPGELAVRAWLENALIARPRFKEFFIGHPALLLGLYLQGRSTRQIAAWDARPWLWLGMLGQVSIVNTFCHLHSPLRFQLLRTVNGLALGACIGFLVTACASIGWSHEK